MPRNPPRKSPSAVPKAESAQAASAKAGSKAPRKLKVYRTATGFRDAYVAAPSRAAALRAWGAEKDLFARGAAEEVTDPALMAEPLASPGEVITRSRGTLAEQVAALGPMPAAQARTKSRPAPQHAAKLKARTKTPPPHRPPPRPRPSRDDLDAIEAALDELKAERAEAEADLRTRERALAAERRAQQRSFSQRLDRLQAKAAKARDAYVEALRSWDG